MTMRSIVYNNKTKEIIFEKAVIEEDTTERVLSTEEKVELLQKELSITQIAVDFVLMENGTNVARLLSDGVGDIENYFAMRILKGKLKYKSVVVKYPELKDEIDSILIAEGRQDLIT